ncbi:TerC family protein [Terrabacter sp. NPDC000476]|uniref:TerC family protein n=1 Tax=Terrabacter sp. NPDC000476 TaxID=3154258 RepID=UPI00332F21C0
MDHTFAVPWWAWAALVATIVVMLGVDLLLHRDHHEIGLREAAVWSGVWIAVGLGFGVVLWVWQGPDVAGTYVAGYLIEKALSIDNVFIFAMVFAALAVPRALQHRVLFWGVIGALVFRLVLIFAGVALLESLSWTAVLLGVLLLYTAWKMAFHHSTDVDPQRNLVVRIVRRVVPTTPAYHGGRFFVRIDGRRTATLLFVALVAVEATDLVFALDSVAAVLAITTTTFIVWAANAFAVLGLRALYFCLSGLLVRFVHLHYGLAVLLAFAGVKLVLAETPVGKLPVALTLGVILVTLAASIVTSLWSTRGTGPTRSGLPDRTTTASAISRGGHDDHDRP